MTKHKRKTVANIHEIDMATKHGMLIAYRLLMTDRREAQVWFVTYQYLWHMLDRLQVADLPIPSWVIDRNAYRIGYHAGVNDFISVLTEKVTTSSKKRTRLSRKFLRELREDLGFTKKDANE